MLSFASLKYTMGNCEYREGFLGGGREHADDLIFSLVLWTFDNFLGFRFIIEKRLHLTRHLVRNGGTMVATLWKSEYGSQIDPIFGI